MRPFRDVQRILLNNRLVQVVKFKDGAVIRQGKRVGMDCILSRDEVRTYATKGAIDCIKLMREQRNIGLKEAYDMLQEACGSKEIA